MIPDYVKSKEQYDEWFNKELDKALKSPVSEESHEDLKKRYADKYSVKDSEDAMKYIVNNIDKANFYIDKSGFICIKIGKIKLYGDWKLDE